MHLAGTSAFNGSNYTYRLYRNGSEVASYTGGPGWQNDFTVGWAVGARGGIAGFERVVRELPRAVEQPGLRLNIREDWQWLDRSIGERAPVLQDGRRAA